jgi:hypothetical protein
MAARWPDGGDGIEEKAKTIRCGREPSRRKVLRAS